MICAAVWVLLAMLLGARIWRDTERVQQEARSPAALTAVAGTAVLGTGLTLLGWEWAGIVLLAVATLGGSCSWGRCCATGSFRPSAAR